jgi:hypothetical protein
MFVVRLLVLLFLVAYGWGMGQEPASGLNAFGKLIAGTFFVTAPLLYFLPTIEAALRKHPNTGAIGAVNAFLGWSLVGWVVALVWALRKPETVTVAASKQEGPFVDTRPQQHIESRATKLCPLCAETILAAAIKCKHCGSNLASTHGGAVVVDPQP